MQRARRTSSARRRTRGPGRRRTTSRQRAPPSREAERNQSTPPLRRSARLNPPTSPATLAERAAAAETQRELHRRESRRGRAGRNRGRSLAGAPSSSRSHHREEAAQSDINLPISTSPSQSDSMSPITNRTYTLEIAIQPPGVVQTGISFYPPFAVRVHIYEGPDEITGEDELSSLFLQAALYRESGNPPPLAPPDMFLLAGQLSRSLELLNEGSGGSGGHAAWSQESGSYALFPDLVVNRPGRYRLGVSMFRIGPGRPMRTSADGVGRAASAGGGTSLQEVKSNTFEVRDDGAPFQLNGDAEQFLEHLRSRGANVPSPPR